MKLDRKARQAIYREKSAVKRLTIAVRNKEQKLAELRLLQKTAKTDEKIGKAEEELAMTKELLEQAKANLEKVEAEHQARLEAEAKQREEERLERQVNACYAQMKRETRQEHEDLRGMKSAEESARVFIRAFRKEARMAREAEKKAEAERIDSERRKEAELMSLVDIAKLGDRLREMNRRVTLYQRGLNREIAMRDQRIAEDMDKILPLANECQTWEESLAIYSRAIDDAEWRSTMYIKSWSERLTKAKAEAKRLKAQIRFIVENGDMIRALVAKGEMAHQHPMEERKNFSTNTKKRQYRALASLNSGLPKDIQKLLKEMEASVEKENGLEDYVTALNAIKERTNRPFKLVLKASDCVRRPFSESELADELGVEYGKFTDFLLLFDHDFHGLLYGKAYEKYGRGNPAVEALLDELLSAFVDAMKRGIDLVRRKQDKKIEHVAYKLLFANASELKQGKATLIKKDIVSKAMPFLTLGQNIEDCTQISGQEEFKAIAVDATPSTAINYGTEAEPKYIHAWDVIMMPEFTVWIDVPSSMNVGLKDGEFTVLMPVKGGKKSINVPVIITVENGRVKITAHDGFLLALIRGLQPKQVRGFGIKGLMVSDRAQTVPMLSVDNLWDAVLAKHPEFGFLPGLPMFVEDIDHNMREVKEGCVLTTLSTWKKKSFFSGEDKPWTKLCENIRKLQLTVTAGGTLFKTVGCLREASSSESDWEYDRHTSRQMLQQFLDMDQDCIHELVERTVRNARDWKTFDGAFRKLAGYAKCDTTAFERAMRLCPQLAAERHFRTLAISKFAEAVAKAGTLNLKCKAINGFLSSDPYAFILCVLRYAKTGETDMTGIKGLIEHGRVCVNDRPDGEESVSIRYPANNFTTHLVKNQVVDLLKLCGRAIFIAFDDVMILIHDADFDGDHLQLVIDVLIVNAKKRSDKLLHELGLDHVVVFNHEGKEKRGQYEPEFIWTGMRDAIVNGQKFNFVGRFSKAATRFMAMASNEIAVAKQYKLAGQETMYDMHMENARKLGQIATLFSVGAILCIDWAKKGVPQEGSEGRRIFDTCMQLLDWAPDKAHGKAIWQQIFRDDDIQVRFWTLSQPEERDGMYGKYNVWKYGAPNQALANRFAAEVCDCAGISFDRNGTIDMHDVQFNDRGVRFVPEMLGWKRPKHGIGKIVVDKRPFEHMCEENIELDMDRRLIADIKAGKPVSWIDFIAMLYRQSSQLERRLAGWVEDARDGAWANDLRSRARAAYRYLILTAQYNFTGSKREVYERIIDEAIDAALELSKTNVIGEKDDTELGRDIKKARFAKWLLDDVFGQDILYRTETVNGVKDSDRTSNIRLCKFDRMQLEFEAAFGSEEYVSDEELLQQMPDDDLCQCDMSDLVQVDDLGIQYSL